MQKALRWLAIAVLTLIPIAVVAYLGSNTNQNDFVEYWSAGKLFVARANPYSGPMILAIEKSRGFAPSDPLIMLNPPWIMPLVAPLGLLPAFGALLLWIGACAGCIAASVVLLELPVKNRGLAFLFAPVLGSFLMEQSSPFLLLGLSLFLRFQRSRPFLAGASLLLMAMKPHLFLVFWVALAGDCLYRRRFRIGDACGTAYLAGLSGCSAHVFAGQERVPNPALRPASGDQCEPGLDCTGSILPGSRVGCGVLLAQTSGMGLAARGDAGAAGHCSDLPLQLDLRSGSAFATGGFGNVRIAAQVFYGNSNHSEFCCAGLAERFLPQHGLAAAGVDSVVYLCHL